jgi:hypothetical protein
VALHWLGAPAALMAWERMKAPLRMPASGAEQLALYRLVAPDASAACPRERLE